MPRPKYKIQEDDFLQVSQYIKKRFFDSSDAWIEPGICTRGGETLAGAEKAFERCTDSLTLNDWCEKYMNTALWVQLKSALRAARKRNLAKNGANEPVVSVSLSRKSWVILREMAESEGLTMSDFIIKKHGDDWAGLRSPGKNTK